MSGAYMDASPDGRGARMRPPQNRDAARTAEERRLAVRYVARRAHDVDDALLLLDALDLDPAEGRIVKEAS